MCYVATDSKTIVTSLGNFGGNMCYPSYSPICTQHIAFIYSQKHMVLIKWVVEEVGLVQGKRISYNSCLTHTGPCSSLLPPGHVTSSLTLCSTRGPFSPANTVKVLFSFLQQQTVCALNDLCSANGHVLLIYIQLWERLYRRRHLCSL